MKAAVRLFCSALLIIAGWLRPSAQPDSAWAGHTGEPIPFDIAEWKTNFKKHSVHLGEIRSGGPPKDGIPAIDHPVFESAAAANAWLKPNEPVITFDHAGEARAYPLQILLWHEIVNDVISGLPVAVTFCPLCNTAIVFDRRLDGRVLDFGTTGKLRWSDLIMYDRQTESWWQQITGEAIVGELTGRRLSVLAAQIVSWNAFRRSAPRGKVLSRRTGFERPYGRNPYAGYDAIGNAPFYYVGPRDKRLPAMERVVTVSLEGEDVAYPFSELARARVVHDTVADTQIVVFYEPGTASALHRAEVGAGRDVGAAGVFAPSLNGRRLTFRLRDGRIIDTESGSAWTILGEAASGPYRGTRLTPLVHGNHLWFSWAVFKPQTRIWRAR
ncbi:MAG: DUF3179 domain-containing protein [Armatimonadota bacterium]